MPGLRTVRSSLRMRERPSKRRDTPVSFLLRSPGLVGDTAGEQRQAAPGYRGFCWTASRARRV